MTVVYFIFLNPGLVCFFYIDDGVLHLLAIAML